MAMKRLLSLKQRISILRELFASARVQEDDRGKEFVEFTLDQLVAAGLPDSATNPAYWSGTSPGLRAAITLNKSVFFSRKYRVIRFYDVTPEDRLIWQERVNNQRQKKLVEDVDDE